MERFHYEQMEDYSFDLDDPQVWTIWIVKDREQTGPYVGTSKPLMSFFTEEEAVIFTNHLNAAQHDAKSRIGA